MRPLTKRALAQAVPRRSSCLFCQSHRRAFASAPAPAAAPAAPPACGLARLPSRQLLSVSGPDTAKFLQGIVTANVSTKDDRTVDSGSYAGFLNATGRVMHDVFIYPGRNGFAGTEEGSSYIIEADAREIDKLAKLIKRYKLRAKVNVRKIDPAEVSVWHAWTDSSLDTNPTATSIRLADPRTADMGCRIIQLGDNPPEADLEQATEDAYTIRRYLRGVPEGPSEILREQALPQESNMDFMNGIEWHKGCYVGQELTIRTKHRGIVRKRILPCIVYDKNAPAPEALAYDPSSTAAQDVPAETSIGRFERRGRSAGKWLRGVGNVGLGLCRLEIMTGTTLPGETAAATFTPQDEFVLEWGQEGEKTGVKVKAFVPEWIQQGLDAHAASR
ncbi:putative transferase-like protein [Emericellopsis cladophorae]|uniref:Iron-sulfur cluster assembly factor IBA57 homolog, mitochondrial n=1 Tax=Emericellopsis cladophorae TaxID=2686198 RepID=A0A9P9Y2W3_9HYPO|nr:putative transferase-like protein [Emericellopsis cladophorae]KAI6782153.1 putative transferase-like protein [Emericellopsis cladophorae]